jgi:hypothetical protein
LRLQEDLMTLRALGVVRVSHIDGVLQKLKA